MLALSPGQADILPRVGETWNTPGDKVGIEQPQATPIGEEEIQLSRASVSEWYCYTEIVPSQNKTATNYFSESKIPCRQRQYQKKQLPSRRHPHHYNHHAPPRPLKTHCHPNPETRRRMPHITGTQPAQRLPLTRQLWTMLDCLQSAQPHSYLIYFQDLSSLPCATLVKSMIKVRKYELANQVNNWDRQGWVHQTCWTTCQVHPSSKAFRSCLQVPNDARRCEDCIDKGIWYTYIYIIIYTYIYI